MKYYRLNHPYKGHHYFKVQEETNNPVLKVTFGTQPKKGRPFCPGVTLINYTTFISSYFWHLKPGEEDSQIAKEISKMEFESALKLMERTLSIKTGTIDFGDYVQIEQHRYGVENEMYLYKVVGQLKSNTYVPVPVVSTPKEENHGEVVPVVRCICCGISETKVLKFRIEDVKLIHNT